MKLFQSLIFLLFLSTSSLVDAQISIGVKGGYTMAWEYYNLDLPEDAEIRVNRGNFAALFYHRLGKHFQIGVEPGFVQRGAACEPGWEPIFEGDTKLFLNYLEVPLMCSGNFPLFKGKVELIAKAGMGTAMIISGYQELTIVGRENPEPREKVRLGRGSRLNRWDMGIYSGAGIGVNIGPGQLMALTESYLGLVDAERFNTSQNRNLNFNLGYLIPLN